LEGHSWTHFPDPNWSWMLSQVSWQNFPSSHCSQVFLPEHFLQLSIVQETHSPFSSNCPSLQVGVFTQLPSLRLIPKEHLMQSPSVLSSQESFTHSLWPWLRKKLLLHSLHFKPFSSQETQPSI